MFRKKRKYFLTLSPTEVALALRALLSFRNKVAARGIDTVDIDVLIQKLS